MSRREIRQLIQALAVREAAERAGLRARLAAVTDPEPEDEKRS